MSLLAHSSLGAPGFTAEKRAAHRQAQLEIIEAKRIQQQTGCGWSEALRLAAAKTSNL